MLFESLLPQAALFIRGFNPEAPVDDEMDSRQGRVDEEWAESSRLLETRSRKKVSVRVSYATEDNRRFSFSISLVFAFI